MSDNIPVKPSDASTALPVATDDIEGTHYPIYKMAFGEDGEVFLVADDTPHPVTIKSQVLTHETDAVILLQEISDKLTVLIEYEILLHKVDLKENHNGT